MGRTMPLQDSLCFNRSSIQYILEVDFLHLKVILFFCSPETDLQGDHHLGVVDPHDVPQVQLAVHHQSIIVSAGPLVFLGSEKGHFRNEKHKITWYFSEFKCSPLRWQSKIAEGMLVTRRRMKSGNFILRRLSDN